MSEIQVPDLARKLARRFGIDGHSPANTLAPEIVPITIVDDLTTPEMQDTGYERACIGYAAISGAVSNNSHTQLFNPANSGVVLLVEAVMTAIASAGNVDYRYHDTELTTAGVNESFRDRRLAGNPVGRTSAQNNATALGTSIASFALPANEGILIPLAVILDAGQGLVMLSASQNVTIRSTFWWTERGKLPGE